MASEDRDQSPAHYPTQPDTQPPPTNPAANPTFPTPEEWDDQATTEQPPDSHDPPEKPADWEFNWRELGYDSLEDARQNVSHVGDPDTNHEWLRESDDQSPAGDESVRHRATGEWKEPDSLY